MKFLANYVMRGPLAAILVVSVSGLLAMLLPPFSYLSGAAVGLVALRVGARQAVLVMTGSAAATSALALLVLGTPWLGLALLLVLWMPVATVAHSLRRGADLARSLLLASLFGVAVVMALHAGLDDPAAWWRETLQQALEQTSPAEQEALQALGAALDTAAGLMTGIAAALLSLSVIVSLLLARWWQAMLYNPGGFRSEFHALRLGRVPGMVTAGLLAALGFMGSGTPVTDLVPLALMLHMLQGIALVHALVAKTAAATGWLVAMYLLLLFALPQTAMALAVAGFVDNWMNFRTLMRKGRDD